MCDTSVSIATHILNPKYYVISEALTHQSYDIICDTQ